MTSQARRIAVYASAAAILLIATQIPAAAQREQAVAGPRPGWVPRRVTLGGDLTAAQRATAMARLEQIERILLQVPELAKPQGFEVMAQFHGGARRLGPGQTEQPGNVVEYLLNLYFFYPTKAIAGEGCTCITIRVNPVDDLGGGRVFDEQGRAIYIEMVRGDPLPLATQVNEGLLRSRERSFVYVLFTSGGVAPWKAVTRAEYYNAMIFDLEGKDGANLTEFRKGLAKTPYQEWMEGAAQRKRDREETLKTMAAMGQPAAEVAKMRKTLEDTERQVTEQFKASEAEHRQSNEKALALSHSITGKMRAELDSMPVAKRNMPALIDATQPEGPNATGWRMVERDSPTAWRVLTPDYDFWRARRSPVEVRAIHVKIGTGGTGLVPAVHNALLQTFDKLDWAAFNQMLDVPR